jgi:diguanylate cyclase (GGDEF)-like protein/PAS domain S-box-containing protein
MLVLALLILGASIGYWLYKDHAGIDARERDRLQAQARVIEENLVHQLKGINGALKNVLNEFPPATVKNTHMGALRHLKALKEGIPGVRAIFILDAEGKLLAATFDNFIAGQNFSHREYYKTPRERPDPAVLYVSTPFTTVVGTFSLNVSRVATSPTGEFAGLVTATLDPDYFNVLLRSVLYAPDMATSIVHADGKVLVVQPENGQTLGKNMSMPGSNFSQFRDSGQTDALTTRMVDATGELRIGVLRSVKRTELQMDKPLVINVGRSVSAIFAPWRLEAFVNGGFYGLFAAVMSIGLYLSQSRRLGNYTARRQAEEALRAREERYRALFDRASDGIMILSTNGELVSINESFARMHGYTKKEMETMNLRDLDTPDAYRTDSERLQRLLSGESLTFEVEHYHKDGHIVLLEVSASLIASDDEPLIQAFHRDITERKQMEAEVRQLALHDTLTKLPNRRLLGDRLGQSMAISKRSACYGALIFLDLDNFKSLNDTQGHVVGDLLLVEAAARLRDCVREADTVARFGGDEFVVMLSELSEDQAAATVHAEVVAEKIRISLSEPYVLTVRHEGNADTTVTHRCTASIGVALFGKQDTSQDDILKWADAAMYKAKVAGRNSIRFHDSPSAAAAIAAGTGGQIV